MLPGVEISSDAKIGASARSLIRAKVIDTRLCRITPQSQPHLLAREWSVMTDSPRARLEHSPTAEAKRLRLLQGGDLDATSEPSDEALVSGLLAGERWAASALYDRLEPVVDRSLRRVLQSNDHDDLVQVVFERIVRTLVERKFAGACSLSTWAKAIAAHVGIDALRTRIRERAMIWDDRVLGAEIAELRTTGSLETQLEARAEIAALQGILCDIDPAQAETLLLHDVYGHELSEIAILMKVSVAAAQSRLVRGRKELLRRARARLQRVKYTERNSDLKKCALQRQTSTRGAPD